MQTKQEMSNKRQKETNKRNAHLVEDRGGADREEVPRLEGRADQLAGNPALSRLRAKPRAGGKRDECAPTFRRPGDPRR